MNEQYWMPLYNSEFAMLNRLSSKNNILKPEQAHTQTSHNFNENVRFQFHLLARNSDKRDEVETTRNQTEKTNFRISFSIINRRNEYVGKYKRNTILNCVK